MTFQSFFKKSGAFKKNAYTVPGGGDITAGTGNFATEAVIWGKKGKLGKNPGEREVSGEDWPSSAAGKPDAGVPPAVSKVQLGEINCGIFTLLPRKAKRNAIANVRPVLTGHLPFNHNLLTSNTGESTETYFKSQR